VQDLERSLRAHPFLRDLTPEQVAVVVACAKNARYPSGAYVVREGEDEHAMLLVRHGTIALEMHEPGRGTVVFETLGAGDVLGVSWMTGMRAKAPVDCRARDSCLCFHLDGDCLKAKMDADPVLGYAIAKRLLERTYARLARARLQHLDVYR
jgi:CRP/FNR family cyclic AMP-dependent transcriptional regulator